jgi:hypothetical protein|tara:strand:- start:1410 stop:1928 length:519 start_codon:yes stop_codon:yes gene_type:complete
MKVLFCSLILFCLAFLVHLITWKIYVPEKQKKTLLQIFIGTLVIGVLAIWDGLPFINVFGLTVSANFHEILHICLFFISLTFSYIVIYSVLDTGSPSLVIIDSIERAGPDGLDKSLLEQRMKKELLLRIKCLDSDKMVSSNDGKYLLTSKGNLFLSVIMFCRRLMNVSDKIG